jgi:hypothetical protein
MLRGSRFLVIRIKTEEREQRQAACMKMRAFWDTVPFILVGTDRRFRRAYCLHQQRDVGTLMMKTVLTSETSVYSIKNGAIS